MTLMLTSSSPLALATRVATLLALATTLACHGYDGPRDRDAAAAWLDTARADAATHDGADPTDAPGPDDATGTQPDATTAVPECNAVGQRRCEGAAVVTCEAGPAGLAWGAPVDCAPNVCHAGHCAVACEHACDVAGARACDGPGAVVTCGDLFGTGCLDWGQPQTCAPGEACEGGSCVACHDCDEGARRCDGAGATSVCELRDGCWRWSPPIPCGGTATCTDGRCCTSTCAVAGQTACSSPTTGTRLVCGDPDGDGCNTYQVTPCPAGQLCVNAGQCLLDPTCGPLSGAITTTPFTAADTTVGASDDIVTDHNLMCVPWGGWNQADDVWAFVPGVTGTFRVRVTSAAPRLVSIMETCGGFCADSAEGTDVALTVQTGPSTTRFIVIDGASGAGPGPYELSVTRL